jgi:signal peptidase II
MRKYRMLLWIGLPAVVADQVTKYLAVAHLTSALDGREGLGRLWGFLTERNLDNHPWVEGGRALLREPVIVFEQFWHFRYAENPGAAWGLFAGLPDGFRQLFFVVVTVAALAFIGVTYHRAPLQQRLLRVSLALVAGGAFGNLLDRLLRGYVIDFIDWHWRNDPSLRWPTFNIADSAISVGVVLMILESFLPRKVAAAAEAPAPARPA